jgi:hypothetical protein
MKVIERVVLTLMNRLSNIIKVIINNIKKMIKITQELGKFNVNQNIKQFVTLFCITVFNSMKILIKKIIFLICIKFSLHKLFA